MDGTDVSRGRELLRVADLLAPARIGVSWAGESVSTNWFDVARELTERWHHQQQIRLALGEPANTAQNPSANAARSLRAIMTPELYHPVLDCFMRALPFHYRSMSAPPGTAITIHVSATAAATGISTAATFGCWPASGEHSRRHRHHPAGHRVAHSKASRAKTPASTSA